MNSDKIISFNEYDILFMYNLIMKTRIRGNIMIEIYPPNSETIYLNSENIHLITRNILIETKIKPWTQIYIRKSYIIANTKEVMLYYWQLDQMLNYFSEKLIPETFYNVQQYKKYLNTSDGYCIDFQLTMGDSRLISKKESNIYIKKLRS